MFLDRLYLSEWYGRRSYYPPREPDSEECKKTKVELRKVLAKYGFKPKVGSFRGKYGNGAGKELIILHKSESDPANPWPLPPQMTDALMKAQRKAEAQAQAAGTSFVGINTAKADAEKVYAEAPAWNFWMYDEAEWSKGLTPPEKIPRAKVARAATGIDARVNDYIKNLEQYWPVRSAHRGSLYMYYWVRHERDGSLVQDKIPSFTASVIQKLAKEDPSIQTDGSEYFAAPLASLKKIISAILSAGDPDRYRPRERGVVAGVETPASLSEGKHVS